jgi:hypothetical protein
VILRESHEGEHVSFRLVHQRGELPSYLSIDDHGVVSKEPARSAS